MGGNEIVAKGSVKKGLRVLYRYSAHNSAKSLINTEQGNEVGLLFLIPPLLHFLLKPFCHFFHFKSELDLHFILILLHKNIVC